MTLLKQKPRNQCQSYGLSNSFLVGGAPLSLVSANILSLHSRVKTQTMEGHPLSPPSSSSARKLRGRFHFPILIMCLAQELGSPLALKLLLSWESSLDLGPAEAVYRCEHVHTLTCLCSALSRARGGSGLQR